eukprot:CAMPEP_0168628620 /NCGR_PEP_ID=MMETSP0449_2-20121227/11945_1 /TAXON_ID=1082188 /ORGANISM="Strombidium rassoulzadegani, Strain ras09" /LENGTH=72 /DNA_ID=CAMNT_0008671059 /DNA_START=82 /DNA_END=300 /DNA_ORIENTATION=+
MESPGAQRNGLVGVVGSPGLLLAHGHLRIEYGHDLQILILVPRQDLAHPHLIREGRAPLPPMAQGCILLSTS